MGVLEENKKVCTDFLSHVARRQFSDAIALVADDIVWWDPGNLPFSGYRHGKKAMEELYGAIESMLEEDMRIEFGALTAEDDRVAVEMLSFAKLTGGREYNNSYHFLFTVKNGVITRCHEYLDTHHTNEMLFPDKS